MSVQIVGAPVTIVDGQNIGPSGTIGSADFDPSGTLGAIFRFTATNTVQLASVAALWSRDGGVIYGTLNAATGGFATVNLVASRDLSVQTGLFCIAFFNPGPGSVAHLYPTPHDMVRLNITNSAGGTLTGLTVTMETITDAREDR